MTTMVRSRLISLVRATIAYCAVVLSTHQASAFVQKGSLLSRHSCDRLPGTMPIGALFAVFDENAQNLPEAKGHYFMDSISDEQEVEAPVDVDPAVVEKNLLSQHEELEKKSMLKEPIQSDYVTEPSKEVHLEETIDEAENPRLAAAIDQSIYSFNDNLVNTLSAAISFFYPTVAKTSPMFSPLIGTEYNEADKEQDVVLRFEKFYILETVARIPYFAYLSVLHVRETLGSRGFLDLDMPDKEANEKRIEAMRTHYAQADNELHHLLIMEALGGNANGFDRLLAHTLAFGYYWFVMLVYVWNDKAAYHLNEIIEDHAYNTYDEFMAEHKEKLKTLPVPDIAKKYYESDFRKNPHLFKAFCAVCKQQSNGPRSDNRPHELNNLYDVFLNIRDDEKEHWMSLCNIVQYGEMGAVGEASVKSTEVRK